MSRPRIFVTGGTGFIGSHLLPKLYQQGYALTVLVRSSQLKKMPGRPELPPETRLVIGDLLKPESYSATLEDHQALIHMAADYRVGLPATRSARQTMYRTNVTATLDLFDAARKAAIPHMVYLSTTAALGEIFGTFPDETHQHNGKFRSYYEETKQIAHTLLLQRQQLGLPVNIAIPGGVFGPGDSSVLSQTMNAFFRGKIPFQITTTSSFQLCHVEHLCNGLVRLVDPLIQRQNFLFTGKDFSMPEVFALLAEVSKRGIPPSRSASVLKPLAWVMDKFAACGLTMPLSQEALRIMDGSSYMYGSEKAKRQLNWSAGDPYQELRAFAQTLAERVAKENRLATK
ncbi:NAD-dependent epimerase/dehydratase family protein [Budvicia diplopodorum]|uniref:NAD-dependent epimerase/dehydratase family protein n=1 Tax=Budvicia diplopodorum TaxID=1119056 RepID=UPI00135C5B4C|nr:NAD-dependent epimerase/dehydratase family protein [Budvicia diplopodorum]